MTPSEEIRRLDARLERIQAAAEPVREWLKKYNEWLTTSPRIDGPIVALLAAIDGEPEEGR